MRIDLFHSHETCMNQESAYGIDDPGIFKRIGVEFMFRKKRG